MQTLFRIGWYRVHRLDGQKDRNHWCLPAWGQTRQRRPFADPRCVPATHSWVGPLTVRAREPRRCAQRIRKISCSSDCCGCRQKHARACLSERSREQVATHCQGIARKAQVAHCRGYETFQRKRTSGGAQALVGQPCSRPSQHIHRRPTPQFA